MVMVRDVNGYITYGIPFADSSNVQTTLAADIEQTTTVPTSPFADTPNILAVISPAKGSDVWVSVNATATLPSSSFSSTASQMNPASRYVKAGDVLHFITSDSSAQLGVSYYAVP